MKIERSVNLSAAASGVRLTRRRLKVLLFGSLFIWSLFVLRLVQIQVLQGDRLRRAAFDQDRQKQPLIPKRGEILDRQGRVLARDIEAQSFFAVPESVGSAGELAALFAPAARCSPFELRRELDNRKNFVWLARQVEAPEVERLVLTRHPGVYQKKELKRDYPLSPLAAGLLGFVDIDRRGLAGVEHSYDSLLTGLFGSRALERDAHGQRYFLDDRTFVPPVNGRTIVLTIDCDLQAILEDELKQGLREARASGATGILLDPRTGEVLALAYLEGRNGPGTKPPAKNRAVADCYEPGSTFKIVTAAAALEEGVKKPEGQIFAENGAWRLGRRVIHDAEKHGWLSFREAVVHSSNIALAKVALEVGGPISYRYAHDFGFGEKTKVDLPGEGRGYLPPQKIWETSQLANFAFGQGVSVNALQLVMAYACIANDGLLLRPYVVKEIGEDGRDTGEKRLPQVVRQVVSVATARTLCQWLAEAVRDGTGRAATVEGLEVAGKTGTAEKPNLERGGYFKNRYVSSFVGFFPADQPRVVGFVAIDDPYGLHFGGQVAAPIFQRVAQRVLPLLPAPPPQLIQPSLVENSGSDAGASLSVNQQPAREENGEPFFAAQAARAEEAAPKITTPASLIGPPVPEDLAPSATVPDLAGLTIREAVGVLGRFGFRARVRGSGVVVAQSPAPGPVRGNTKTVIITGLPPVPRAW